MISCADIQIDISSWVDEELNASRTATVEKHLESCAKCAAFHQDLQSIREGVKGLEPLDPPEKLWTSLRFQLETEGLIRDKSKKSFWSMLLDRRFPDLKPAWSGAILALLLGFGSFLVYDFKTRLPLVLNPVASTSHQEVLHEELNKAENNYRAAIEALSVSSQKTLEELDPLLAKVFQDNLATMDHYLTECKQAVGNNPKNPLAHRHLLAAYKKKVELMQTIATFDSLL